MANPNNVYEVVITTLTGGTNGDGFVDATTIENYLALGSIPTSDALVLSKIRANMRWESIINALGVVMSFKTFTPVAAGATANTPATSFSFFIRTDDGLFATADELNAGAFLGTSAAVKRCVARGLLANRTSNRRNFDPGETTYGVSGVPGSVVAAAQAAKWGPRVDAVTAGPAAASIAAAEAAITVTIIYQPN